MVSDRSVSINLLGSNTGIATLQRLKCADLTLVFGFSLRVAAEPPAVVLNQLSGQGGDGHLRGTVGSNPSPSSGESATNCSDPDRCLWADDRLRHRRGAGVCQGNGLPARGSRIRTFRPFPDQCLSELVEPCAETTCAPEGFLHGGTVSSNPSPSSGESATNCSGVGLRWFAESRASTPTPSAGRAAIEVRPASRPHHSGLAGDCRLHAHAISRNLWPTHSTSVTRSRRR
jgi:hypothetical protein